MGYFTMWPEVCTIHNQEASTVEDALMTNFFCCARVLRELHSDQGWNFMSQFLQEVLQCLGISKARTTSLYL
jgi:hypothetical protein